MLNIELRSKTFSEMKGHDKIVSEMKKMSIDNSFPHYALMTGLSGSGKSSLMLLIAKLLNCHNPIVFRNGTKEPCNECPSCKDVNSQRFSRDVIYYDANYIDKEEAKKIKRTSNVTTLFDRNKIYIIDEAHCIASSQAKSIFLTLTEKEKKHLYIFFATTQEKAFDTALKRRFRKYIFKESTFETISSFLFETTEKLKEQYEIPEKFYEEGLFTVAYNCQGSFGIALDLLETCLNRKVYSNDEILEEINIVSLDIETELLKKLLEKDANVLPSIIKFNLEEFYYRTMKILTSVLVYQKTGYTDQDWKRKNAEIFKKFDILELLEYYKKAEKYPYFNKDSFIVSLVKYLDTKKIVRRIAE
jgi:DNA polymerase III subunit gamma/tau